jgi:PGF-CTERM protein
MRTSTLTTTLVAALLLVSASAGGAVAATAPIHAQQSPTGTPGTEMNGTVTTVGADGQSRPSITFNDQEISGPSSSQSVLIQSVTVSQPGFIVIYDSTRSGNEANQIIGTFHLLGSGTFNNIPVPLDTPINQSTSLTAIIHLDSNSNGRFDYVSSNGTKDPPLTPQGDQRIVDIAQITVQSDSGGTNTTEAGTSDEANTATASSSGAGEANRTDGNASGGSDGSSGSGPGFGLVVGVVALLAGALLAVQRN